MQVKISTTLAPFLQTLLDWQFSPVAGEFNRQYLSCQISAISVARNIIVIKIAGKSPQVCPLLIAMIYECIKSPNVSGTLDNWFNFKDV